MLSLYQRNKGQMHWFYSQNIKKDEILLENEEAQHALKVLRLHTGDHVHVTDGLGNLFLCEISHLEKKAVRARIIEKKEKYKARDFKIHIAIAPTKNISRFEWFLEKCTEIGIDRISPIICKHSERKIIKPARLNKIIIAATKQSQKAQIPSLEPLMKFQDFISLENQSQKFIAYCDYEINTHLIHLAKAKSDCTILIGPEGDFSPDELKSALNMGYQTCGLGPERLRTETAGIIACNAIHFINQ